MNLTGYQAYCLFIALRNHFNTESYDYFTYKGKINTPKSSFETRRDHLWFERIAKRYSKKDLPDFFLANIIEGNTWIVDLVLEEEKHHGIFMEYKKRKEAFTYVTEQALNKLLLNVDNPKSLFRMSKGQYPKVVMAYFNKVVPLETLVVLDDFVNFVPVFDKKIGKDDVIWSPVSLSIKKYRPFLSYDKEKMKILLQRKILNKK
jgi:T4 gene Gp59 loader of gp41 DNA helicase/T4 gene Gp59 loader of gp41 DNA helicase C-term